MGQPETGVFLFPSIERVGRSLSFHVRHADRERQKGSITPRTRSAASGRTLKGSSDRTTDSSVGRPVLPALHDCRVARSASRRSPRTLDSPMCARRGFSSAQSGALWISAQRSCRRQKVADLDWFGAEQGTCKESDVERCVPAGRRWSEVGPPVRPHVTHREDSIPRPASLSWSARGDALFV